jgi:limonene-1,2-epoxide hydrolase
MPAPIGTVRDFIATFVEAWPAAETAALGSYFSQDAVYHNGPLEPVRGRVAIETAFADFMEMGGRVEVEIIHIVADGPIVMTERVDRVVKEDGTIVSLPVMGVIEIRDGLISRWRDYFDLNQLTTQVPEAG